MEVEGMRIVKRRILVEKTIGLPEQYLETYEQQTASSLSASGSASNEPETPTAPTDSNVPVTVPASTASNAPETTPGSCSDQTSYGPRLASEDMDVPSQSMSISLLFHYCDT